MRPVLTLLLALAALAGTASAAQAVVTVRPDARSLATEDVDSEDSIPTVVANGDAGADRIVVEQDASGVLVAPADPATTVRVDPVAAGDDDPGCVAEGTGVRCRPLPDQELEVALDAGDDAVTIAPPAPDAANAGVGVTTTLDGGPGDDVLTGGPAADELVGGPGLDRLDGGAGSDVAGFADEAAGVQVDAQAGTATTPAGTEPLVGIEGATGSAFDDVLRASDAGGRLVGGAGDDELLGGAGDDEVVAVDPDRTGAADGGPGDGADVVVAGDGDDSVTASSGDRVDAGAGDDALDVSPEDGRLAPSTRLRCGAGTDRVPLHAAALVLGPDCERFAEARQYLTSAGDFAGTLRFTRTSPRALRVSSGQRCRVLQVRLRTARGRVTAVRSLRGTAPVGFGVPRGTSSVEALGCGSRRWSLQARVRR